MGKGKAVGFALLAAIFYAISVPFSKLLLAQVAPTVMAGLLYLGAGIGVGCMQLARGRRAGDERLGREDVPYVVGMVALDIAAPILLMLGIAAGSSSSASLLGNFEIVATTLIALFAFHEKVTPRLWVAVALITIASALLSFEGAQSLRLSPGSALVLLAACCWGLENNCTRKISHKSAYQIVVVKGLCCGMGSLCIALAIGEALPPLPPVACALALGFVAYGLSIFFYVRAQSSLGAAKTSAYYAMNPFIGAFLAFAFLHEPLTGTYLAALAIMAAGTALVVADTLVRNHTHIHMHTITHTHGGTTHTHVIEHDHAHSHYVGDARHGHRHTEAELKGELEHHA